MVVRSGMRNVRMKRYEKLIIYPYFLLINFPFSSVSILFFYRYSFLFLNLHSRDLSRIIFP